MKWAITIWILVLGLNAAERSVEAHGLNVRSFAEDGRLLRRFIAESATGPFTSPVVKQGKVEFYGKEVEILALRGALPTFDSWPRKSSLPSSHCLSG
jgi:hypothetical protein